MSWKRLLTVLVLLALSWSMALGDAEARRKKSRYIPPPLKILDISTSPMPFAPGHEPLAITIDVALPKDLSGVDLLEVSSLISFPSMRSIRFLYSRLPIQEIVDASGRSKISTTLLWDGKDQTNQLVGAGTYKYEVRAKLMSNKEGPPRTKIVSLRARGELEVSPPHSTDHTPTHMEHVPFVSDETPAEELGDGSTDIENADTDPSENNNEEAFIQEPVVEEVIPENETGPIPPNLEGR